MRKTRFFVCVRSGNETLRRTRDSGRVNVYDAERLLDAKHGLNKGKVVAIKMIPRDNFTLRNAQGTISDRA